jgi:hypothetical protein
MSALDLLCILAGVIVLPMALIPFLVESGKRDGIVKTGQSGDDR